MPQKLKFVILTTLALPNPTVITDCGGDNKVSSEMVMDIDGNLYLWLQQGVAYFVQ